MDDAELDILANLIEADGLDENEPGNLDSGQDQAATMSANSQNMSSENKRKNKLEEGSSTTERSVSRKFTEMENYIKFLESQLKTQNSEKNKSPETNNVKPNSKKYAPVVHETENKTKLSNYRTPARDTIKETATKSGKGHSKTSQSMRDTGSVTKQTVSKTPKSIESSSNHERELKSKSSGLKRKAEGPLSLPSAPKRPVQDLHVVTDGFSGLRILNPLVSSATMERRMEGRKMIKISSIQSKIRNNDVEGDWVTIGVLVQKLPPKTSAKGNQYSIWKLSDLAFHLGNSIVSFFLFGETHKENWKTSEGTVVALLNPSIMPSREKQSKDIALTVDNPKKVMMMGVSQDFGRCQGTRKADGTKCSNFINKTFGDFCEYHVRREYSKMRSKRMECQQGYGAPSKPSGSKLRKKVASESFFYQGKTVSSNTPPPRKDKVTLKSLASNASAEHLSSWKGKQAGKAKLNGGEPFGDKDGPSEDFLNLLKIPTVGSRNLKRQLQKEENKDVTDARQLVSASEFLKTNKAQEQNRQVFCCSPTAPFTRTSAETSFSKDTSDSLGKIPVLGRGLNCDDDLIFDENVPENVARNRSTYVDKGKRRALALVREMGPFSPNNPNDIQAKKPPRRQNAIKTKLEKGQSTVKDVTKTSTFTLANDFDLNSEAGQKLLKAKSRHTGEVKQAEIEQEEQYFKLREKKEAMEAKMLTIKELKVKVFHCAQCKYVAEKASAICKEEKHELRSLTALKKFFACRQCKERTVTYGQRYPKHFCRKCGGRHFEACAMFQERKGPQLGGETLLIRGLEHSKFLTSLKSPKTNGVLPKYL